MSRKVAIVTGSSSGIGRTTAIAIAKEGIKVVIAARREKEREETLRLVKESGGDGMFPISIDTITVTNQTVDIETADEDDDETEEAEAAEDEGGSEDEGTYG